MKWRSAAQYVLMWCIRYTPLPWSVKQWAIQRAIRSIIVVGTALIPDEHGRILVLRARYSGSWIAPGGAVNPGEDPLTGTRRECREELGLQVTAERLVGLYSVVQTRLLFVAFRCAPLVALPRLGAEHETFRYMTPPELPDHLRAMAEDMAREDLAPVVRTLHRVPRL